MYYFAYGSNLSHRQMKMRCPSASFIGRGWVKGYCLCFDGHSDSRNGPVGNVVESANDLVWGGLYLIDQASLAGLDRYEGYQQKVYDRKLIQVTDDTGGVYLAWVYLRDPQKIARPHQEYLQVILEGAKDCGLPDAYIECITIAAGREEDPASR
jgi:gamma-glutamylcyclotransferase